MRLRVVPIVCSVLALTIGVATARAGNGGETSANLCRKGGWMNYTRTDGKRFRTEDACVRYAAGGGILVPISVPISVTKTQAQLDCESAGATYGADNQFGFTPPGFVVAWTCNGNGVIALVPTLFADCGSLFFAWTPVGTMGVPAFTCFKPL